MIADQKLCMDIVFNAPRNIYFGNLLEPPHWFSKYTVYEEIWVNQDMQMILPIKDSLEQQTHFNGNDFGNTCCRCDEGSLYLTLLAVLIIVNIIFHFYPSDHWANFDYFKKRVPLTIRLSYEESLPNQDSPQRIVLLCSLCFQGQSF